MNKSNKAYVYRAYPNRTQEVLAHKTFGCCRFVYNAMLWDKQQYYKENKKSIQVTPAKYKERFDWLNEVDSLALANEQMNLDSAYRNFFSSITGKRKGKKVSYPKRKLKKLAKNSYSTNMVNGNIKLVGNKLKLPKIGFVKLSLHRPLPANAKIKKVTLTKLKTNKFYVSILLEFIKKDEIIPEIKELDVNRVVGIDMSFKHLFVTSDGEKANYQQNYRNAEKKLAKQQRRFSRKKKMSQNRGKQKIILAKIHEKISNQRKDFVYKQARQITKRYDIIVLEDINMQNMSRTLNFGKSVNDLGFGMFKNRLKQICLKENKHLIFADKFFPSTQLCSVCEYKNANLTLADREWDCPECGTHHDRDINSGKNLKNYFLKDYSGIILDKENTKNTVGLTGINACGDKTSTLKENSDVSLVAEAGSHYL